MHIVVTLVTVTMTWYGAANTYSIYTYVGTTHIQHMSAQKSSLKCKNATNVQKKTVHALPESVPCSEIRQLQS